MAGGKGRAWRGAPFDGAQDERKAGRDWRRGVTTAFDARAQAAFVAAVEFFVLMDLNLMKLIQPSAGFPEHTPRRSPPMTARARPAIPTP